MSSAAAPIQLRVAKPRKLEFPLTPMLDVMFILLTVFIAISEARQSVHEIELPELAQESAQPVVVDDSERVPLVVQLREDGAVFLDGEPIAAEELEPTVRAAKEQHGELLKVELEADSGTDYEKVFALMVELKLAGITDVSLPYVTTGEE